jgi:osmoprotectant transport system permease protein
MDAFGEMVDFFSDAANWRGSTGIPNRLAEHLWFSTTSVLAALIPAIGLGLYIGHRRRFEFLVTVAGLSRAFPSFGVLAISFSFALAYGIDFSFWPTFAALFFLAIPPMLTNAYVGVKAVDPDAIEAAKGMGMTGREVLRRVELPLAAPLIMAGIRTSVVQVIATATLAAVVAGGGLGRFIVDGFARQNDGLMLGGAALVAAMAITAEIVMAGLERLVSPRTTSHPTKVRPFEKAGQVPRTAGL